MSYIPNSITNPAQGDILYYNGSKFVNLAHGSSGQYLQTNGAAANPSWETFATTISGDVTLSPSTSSRNTIQAAADTAKPLSLKGHSATQSANLFEVAPAPAAANVFAIDPTGFTLSEASGVAAGSELFQINNSSGAYLLKVLNTGSALGMLIAAESDTDPALVVQANSGTQTSDIFAVQHDYGPSKYTLRVGNNKIGFFNNAPVARPAAYTLSGSATRTFPTDPSVAYTGIDNAQAGTVYATVADLNTLRAAVSTLIGVVRQGWTDLGNSSGYGLLQA